MSTGVPRCWRFCSTAPAPRFRGLGVRVFEADITLTTSGGAVAAPKADVSLDSI